MPIVVYKSECSLSETVPEWGTLWTIAAVWCKTSAGYSPLDATSGSRHIAVLSLISACAIEFEDGRLYAWQRE